MMMIMMMTMMMIMKKERIIRDFPYFSQILRQFDKSFPLTAITWKIRRCCHIMASALVISSIYRQNVLSVMSLVMSHTIIWVFAKDEISPTKEPSSIIYQTSWPTVVKISFWMRNFRRDWKKPTPKNLYARHTRIIRHISLLSLTPLEKLQTFQPTSRTSEIGREPPGKICTNTVRI